MNKRNVLIRDIMIGIAVFAAQSSLVLMLTDRPSVFWLLCVVPLGGVLVDRVRGGTGIIGGLFAGALAANLVPLMSYSGRKTLWNLDPGVLNSLVLLAIFGAVFGAIPGVITWLAMLATKRYASKSK
jgi:hypothetical protein